MTAADWGLYRDGHRQEGVAYDDAVAAARDGKGFLWIGLHEPDDRRLNEIAEEFGLHPLAVEDAADVHEGPKVEHYQDSIFMVLKTARYLPREDIAVPNEIETGKVMVFIGSHFAVVIRHGRHGELDPIRARLDADPRLVRSGPSAILYAVADVTVDGYLDVAEQVEADITDIEAAVFADEGRNQAERIYRAKREVLDLRRAVVPLGQPVRTLAERPLELIDPAVRTYLRDVSDHLDRLHALLSGYDEIVNSMLQANLAQLSVSQNNDMRKITSWAAIIAVPTAIAGIYGMNFTDMPELHWALGYPAVLVAMAIICLVLYWNFRRRGWL